MAVLPFCCSQGHTGGGKENHFVSHLARLKTEPMAKVFETLS